MTLRNYFMFDRAEAFHLNPDPITGRQEPGGIKRKANPLGRARKQEVAGLKSQGLGEEVDHLLGPEDHVSGTAVLPRFAVHPAANGEAVRVGDLVGSSYPGPPRAEGVGAFGSRPVALSLLKITSAYIVCDRIADDRLIGTHDHGQLGFVVESPNNVGDHYWARRRSRAATGLQEDRRFRRQLLTALGRMLGVVQGDAEDSRRHWDRREQLNFIERPGPTTSRIQGAAAQAVQNTFASLKTYGEAISNLTGHRIGNIRRNEGGEFHGARA